MTRIVPKVLVLTFMFGMVASYGAHTFLFDMWTPLGVDAEGRQIAFRLDDLQNCLTAKARAMVGLTRDWQGCAAFFDRYQALDAFNLRAGIFGSITGITTLALIGLLAAIKLERPPPKIVRGRRLLRGRAGLRAFAKASKAECKLFGEGLELLPDVPVSWDRESRHWLIWGSVGGGKTQTMLRLIWNAIVRTDAVMVLDIKGDMMAGLPEDPILLAPHDQRTVVWDVARDCQSKQDARELAARFIPASHDPMWAEAAREIFVACIHHLQITQPENWHWADLHSLVTQDAEGLQATARASYPDACRLLREPGNKTTQSILVTFQTHMNTVAALADAWHDPFTEKFSVTEWLEAHEPYRPVILQRDARYPELSNAWIGGLIGLMGSAVGSPSLRESHSRRVWLFADEFPQLPKIDQFPTILDLGRTKGVIVVLGAQDIAQLRKTYGRDLADAWLGMIGTQIITRINPGPGAEEAARLLGAQEVEQEMRSVTMAGNQRSVAYSTQRQIRPVITATELSTRLGPTRKGIRVLVLGPGEDAYELTMPYVELPDLRAATVPANWTCEPPKPPPIRSKVRPASTDSLLSEDLAERIRKIRH